MKNLITGGAGFIGSHLAEYLLARGEEVIVLDDLSTGSYENIKHLRGKTGFTYYIGKVENDNLLEKIIEKVQKIYHLAAAVGVRLIVDDPVHTIETNINATQAILELAVTYGKPVLITSTSEVYGKGNPPFSEDDDVVYGPTSRSRWSYAISKSVDEFLFISNYNRKGLLGVIVRLFNTVGPRQIGRYGMVVPRLVDQAIAGRPLTIYGTGNQTRCFVHVLDVVPALYSLLNCPEAMGKVVNVGNDVEVSINELAEQIRKAVNPGLQMLKVPYEEAYGSGFEDMGSRKPVLERVRSLIGYTVRFGLEEIIRDVIDFKKGRWKPGLL